MISLDPSTQSLSVDDTVKTEEDRMKDISSSVNHTVIERLDSLVLGTPLSSLEADANSSQASGSSSLSSKSGILKDVNRDRSSPDKKRGISFPDYEELQEIIGYGGDMYYSSDDDEVTARPDHRPDKHQEHVSEELTQEERNVLNITKKNTSFNSHPQNLKDPNSSPLPKLGVDKKHTPVISVRPFVRDNLPGKVNMVSPMINGEVVTSNGSSPPNKTIVNGSLPAKEVVAKKNSNDSKMFGSVKRLEKDESGRGEIKLNKKDSLGSDGSTENSSSDSDSSNNRDSPSPTEFELRDKDRDSGEVFKKQSSFLASHIADQKSGSSSVKSQYQSDRADDPPSNNAQLSLLTSSLATTSSDCKKDDKKVDAVANDRSKAAALAASARLSFLNSTIGGMKNTEHSSSSSSSLAPGAQSKTQSSLVMRDKLDGGDVTAARAEVIEQITEHKDNLAPSDAHHNDSKVEKVVSSSRTESCRDSPRVKLTRKSPSAVGQSSSILKGTPKPLITRKPPILKDKPKVPLKPNKLMMRSPSSSPSPSPSPPVSLVDDVPQDNHDKMNDHQAPVAAPRKASFCSKKSRAALNDILDTDTGDAGGEESITDPSQSSPRDPVSRAAKVGENQSETVAGGDGRNNNSLVISVVSAASSDSVTTSNKTNNAASTTARSGKETSPPQVQKNLTNKNKEALEAIRKSLSNKLILPGPPHLVMESIKASEGHVVKSDLAKPKLEKTTSNSFEENRASIAEALQFARHEPVNKTKQGAAASKRQAPGPPDDDGDETVNNNEANNDQSTEASNSEEAANECKDDDDEEEVSVPAEPKLTPAIRNSSMKSENSGKSKELKTVQFSPDTVTVTVPSTPSTPKMVSYNNWMGGGPGGRHHGHHHGHPGQVQSSFTGQPIAMFPPGVVTSQMKKQQFYASSPVIDEGPRKWTEKKTKWRSKSQPRSSEIDEIIGSSKTKTQTRLAIFTPSSPQPLRRQSRVEIYESEKQRVNTTSATTPTTAGQQQQLQKKGKFSLKKLFKLQPGDDDDVDDNKLIDKDHEREILERKSKQRPEIIHPLDLINSGVEVVKITPKNQVKHQFDKHKSGSKSSEKSSSAMKRQMSADHNNRLHSSGFNKSDSDSKDSGHDTSSIHTETSEGSGSSSGGDVSHVSSVEFSPGPTPVGVVPQVRTNII